MDENLVTEQTAQALHNREPESESTAAFARGIVDLMEFLEYYSKICILNTDAGVQNCNTQFVCVPSAAEQHFSSLRVLDRVREQVKDHLLKQPPVASYRHGRGTTCSSRPFACA
jgi:hypothetical protein